MLAQSSTDAPQTKSHHPFSPLPSNKSRKRDTRTCLFQSGYSQLNYHKQDFPKSPELWFALDRALTTFLYTKLLLPIPYSCSPPPPPNSQHPQSDPHPESKQRPAVELPWRSSQRVKSVGCFRRGAPSLMFDWILNMTLPKELFTIGFTQRNPKLLLSPNSLDSHQIENKKMKFWTNPRSSFPIRRTHPLGR